MDELRMIISSIYSRNMRGNWTYEYTNLEHIEDLDKRIRLRQPANVIGRIEYCYSEFSILWNVHDVVNYVWLTDNGLYIIDIPDPLLEVAIKKWLQLVFDKYNGVRS